MGLLDRSDRLAVGKWRALVPHNATHRRIQDLDVRRVDPDAGPLAERMRLERAVINNGARPRREQDVFRRLPAEYAIPKRHVRLGDHDWTVEKFIRDDFASLKHGFTPYGCVASSIRGFRKV